MLKTQIHHKIDMQSTTISQNVIAGMHIFLVATDLFTMTVIYMIPDTDDSDDTFINQQ